MSAFMLHRKNTGKSTDRLLTLPVLSFRFSTTSFAIVFGYPRVAGCNECNDSFQICKSIIALGIAVAGSDLVSGEMHREYLHTQSYTGNSAVKNANEHHLVVSGWRPGRFMQSSAMPAALAWRSELPGRDRSILEGEHESRRLIPALRVLTR